MSVPGEVAILRGWRLVTTVRAPALLGQAALLEPLGVDCPEVTTRLHTGGCVRLHTGGCVRVASWANAQQEAWWLVQMAVQQSHMSCP